jgi:hypothetical protein
MTTTTNLTDTTWETSGSRWDSDTIARVAWSVIAQPGSSWVSALIAERGATEALERALVLSTNETLPCIPPLNRRSVARKTAQALQTTADCGYRLVSPSHQSWPSQLDAMADEAPLLLWVQGDAALLSSLTTVVTGTRAMSAHGLHMALDLASGLADHGHTIAAGRAPRSYRDDGANYCGDRRRPPQNEHRWHRRPSCRRGCGSERGPAGCRCPVARSGAPQPRTCGSREQHGHRRGRPRLRDSRNRFCRRQSRKKCGCCPPEQRGGG